MILPYNIDVLIGQMVKIMENGEELKLSKRAGTIITLEELGGKGRCGCRSLHA
jgi:arginyl-tRNA synthetase